MAIQNYSTLDPRIGKIAGEMLRHAIHTEVLVPACKQLDMPKNKSDTMICRAWVPYGATVAAPNSWTVTADSHITQEGVTPAADTILARDVTFTLNQYSILYSLTDRDYDLYEDKIADAMKEQTGERAGLVRELAIYGKMKACTNKFYAGGTSRGTVDEAVTEGLVAKVIRSLKAAHAQQITKVLSSSGNFGTVPVEASYVCYIHTDAEYDIRRLAGFRECAGYGQRTLINEYELGTWQNVRFILSPELASIPDSGAAIGTTGLKSTTGTYIDIYPMIFLAKDAFAQVKLRDEGSLVPVVRLPGESDSGDPLGQRGYIGCKFYHAAEVLNSGWMAIAEIGITSL